MGSIPEITIVCHYREFTVQNDGVDLCPVEETNRGKLCKKIDKITSLTMVKVDPMSM